MPFGLKVVADAIAAGESVGDYSAKNPTSSAHGRYQFTAATDADVSKKIQNYGEAPEDQDKKFAYLASTAYRQQTGRDLAEDAAAGGHEMQIADALKGVWPSVPGGLQQNTSAMAWMRHMIDARAAYGPQLAPDKHANALTDQHRPRGLHAGPSPPGRLCAGCGA